MPLVLEFGSRAASWFALVLFSVMFAALGWAVAREVRLRSRGTHAALGRVLGVVLFSVPPLLLYLSSLAGFYEAEVGRGAIRLHYLFPAVVSEIPTQQSSARVVPAHRGLARLVITTPDGTYESTPWTRARVADALTQLNAALGAVRGFFQFPMALTLCGSRDCL